MDRDGYISNGELFLVLKMMVGNNLKVRACLKDWFGRDKRLHIASTTSQDQQLQQIVDKSEQKKG